VRIDKVQIDSTVLNERLKELVKAETEAVGPPSPKLRQRLKQQAEDELMQHPMPRSTIIECVLEEAVLYVGTTAKSNLGVVTELLRRIGVEVEIKSPWLDAGQDDEFSELIEVKEPGQSIWGCRFLKKLLSDPEVFVEPEKGSVKMVTPDGARVSLSGPVINEVDRLLENGAEMLGAKLMVDAFAFGFDALSCRFSGLKLDNHKSKHWTEQLDLRLDQIKELWSWLDTKYQALMLE
jgi:hypothetical protein